MTHRNRNVLVVATVAVDGRELQAYAPELALPDGASVRVVSPAACISRVQWLTNEEDAARETAARVASDMARAAETGTGAEIDVEVGDADPIRAAEDALAMFPADELVVLVRSRDRASWLERSAMRDGFERFGVPVRYVVVGGAGSDGR